MSVLKSFYTSDIYHETVQSTLCQFAPRYCWFQFVVLIDVFLKWVVDVLSCLTNIFKNIHSEKACLCIICLGMHYSYTTEIVCVVLCNYCLFEHVLNLNMCKLTCLTICGLFCNWLRLERTRTHVCGIVRLKVYSNKVLTHNMYDPSNNDQTCIM